ncbi:helix-turn-helix transcriptional regulator [uncultured Polaribacter sp.]|uniref:helix-turn-helix domain-containing protein n=1 Tax=uncultured Polaribacter sp. TaxID=174711 RepID=UPI00262373B4|nr:helix-turn-helix transcriptional regulator [uncultured Polaribacter sp.]
MEQSIDDFMQEFKRRERSKMEREIKKTQLFRKRITILRKIAKERQKAGLSQYDMGIKIGLTESGYFKVEKGATKLDLERLLEILDVLNITLINFFKDINED